MRMRHLVVAAAVLVAACDSPLNTEPTASIDAETALNNARGIELGLNGAYRSLQIGPGYFTRDLIAYPDMYADNLDFTGTFQTDREFALRDVATNNANARDLWGGAYVGINRANNILAAIPNATGMTDAQRSLARGEALFVRALHYSRLAAWFGGVPLVLEPSRGVGESALVSRSSRQDVYTRIVADLEEAVPLLPAGRTAGRATQGAANALLARVQLEIGNHAQARDRANAVITSGTYSLVPNFGTLYSQKHSAESIFEMQFTANTSNSLAFWFFPAALGGRLGMSPTAALYNAYGAGDVRRDVSIRMSGTTRYIGKYTRIALGDDNIIELRLAEMYLIRAEANARLNAPAATVRADINAIRNRAGATPVGEGVTSQAGLLDAILHERRLELAFEGRRFFDLRRFGVAEQVLNISANRLLLPVPQSERDVNPNLDQNPGY
jgi:starch-binding outer membrane protein, SusD/RagB family